MHRSQVSRFFSLLEFAYAVHCTTQQRHRPWISFENAALNQCQRAGIRIHTHLEQPHHRHQTARSRRLQQLSLGRCGGSSGRFLPKACRRGFTEPNRQQWNVLKLSNGRREKVAIFRQHFTKPAFATKTLHTGSRTLGPVRVSCFWPCQGLLTKHFRRWADSVAYCGILFRQEGSAERLGFYSSWPVQWTPSQQNLEPLLVSSFRRYTCCSSGAYCANGFKFQHVFPASVVTAPIHPAFWWTQVWLHPARIG